MKKEKIFTARKAFTLAEVLITLGIIGIVAAMTIPGLITNIQHRDYSAKLKKFYSTIKQAILSAEDEFGSVSSWDTSLSNKEFIQTYLGPFIKFTYKKDTDYAYFSDGTSLKFTNRGDCLDIVYDVTGETKPNKLGFDRFSFLLCPDTAVEWGDGTGGFITYKYKNVMQLNSRQKYLDYCKSGAHFCSALLEYDNWEFKKDYPYLK